MKDRSVKIKELAVECSQERQKKMDEKMDMVLEGHQLLKEIHENLLRHLLSHPVLDRSTREPITNRDNGKDPGNSKKPQFVGE